MTLICILVGLAMFLVSVDIVVIHSVRTGPNSNSCNGTFFGIVLAVMFFIFTGLAVHHAFL